MSIFSPSIATPKEKKSLGNINADQLNSNQQAVPVKYFAGRRIIAGDYITPAYNQKAVPIKTKASKVSDSQVTGYTYYADFALVFCFAGRHPVDAIYRVIVESEIVWEGTVTRGAAEYEDIIVSDFGSLRIYWGSATQLVDPTLTPRGTLTGGIDPRDQDTWPPHAATGGQTTSSGEASGDSNPLSGHYDESPAYRYQSYGVFTNWKIGDNRTSIPNIQVELKRGVPFIGGTQLTSDDRGANIVGVIYDILTDPLTGAGLPDSLLLSASWTTTKTDFDNFRISPLITGQEDLRSVVGKLLDSADLFLRRNGTQLEIGSWAHGNIDPATLPQIFDDDLADSATLRPLNFNDTINRAVVVYKDRNHYYNDASQVAMDANNRRIVGVPRIAYLTLDHLTDPDLAAQFAAEYRTIFSQPSQPGTLPLKRERVSALGLLHGMRVRWNSTKYSLQIVCRLLDTERADDKTTKVAFNMEGERGLWPNHWVPGPVPGDGDFHLGPTAIVRRRMIELPQGLKPDNAPEIQLLPLAVRSNAGVVNFKTWISNDLGTTYDLAQAKCNFSAYGNVDNYQAPSTISGLKLWLSAASITGLSDGDPVGTWSDLSGNAHHCTQATAGFKPIYRTNKYNGLPAVKFDGVDDFLRSSAGAFNGAHTMFAIFTAFDQTGYIASFGENSTGKLRSIVINALSGPYTTIYSSFGTVLDTGLSPAALQPWGFVVDGSGNASAFFNDFSAGTASVTLTSHAGTTFTIGAGPTTTPALFANAYVAEILVFDSALSTANRQLVIDYLSLKYRLSSQIRLYGVDLDTVVSQTQQQQNNFSLLAFSENEVMSVGHVTARGSGLYKIFFTGGLYGTSRATHPAGTDWYFIPRGKITPIEHESLIPGATVFFKLQPATNLQEYDLASVVQFGIVLSTPVPIPLPALSPGSSSFVTSLAIDSFIPSGYTGRYTTDDTPVKSTSRVWPAAGITITQQCAVRLACYDPKGAKGEEARCFYTQVASSPVSKCGNVSWQFSGAQGRTSGNLTLACATGSSTIHYIKNNGSVTTYSTPLALVLGDTVEFYATATGSSASDHGYFDNTRDVTGGGGGDYGGGGGGGHHENP